MTAFFSFFYFLGYSFFLSSFLSFFSFLSSFFYSGAYFTSASSFFNLFMVALAVVATLVANSKAPPAKEVLQPLHLQIPQATLLTLVWNKIWIYLSARGTQILGVLLEFEFLDNFSNCATISSSIFSCDTHLLCSFGHWL